MKNFVIKVQGEISVTDDNACPEVELKTAVQLVFVQKECNASATIDTVCRVDYKDLTWDDVKMMYISVFNNEHGRYPGKYKATLVENAEPKVNAPRRVAHNS